MVRQWRLFLDDRTVPLTPRMTEPFRAKRAEAYERFAEGLGICFGCCWSNITPMPTTPPYLNAPLQLTVLEVRHPPANYLTRGEVAGLKQALQRVLPFHMVDEMQEVRWPAMSATPRSIELNRFVSRDKRTCVTFGPEAISVETTDYPGWTHFKEVVRSVLDARQDIAPVDGVTRLGIRFIDEIRVPVTGAAIDWSEWVAESLIAPRLSTSELALEVRQQQSVVEYVSGDNETLTVRFGQIDGPPAVASSPHLARPDLPPPGPYFLIDTDVAWAVQEGEAVPELSVDQIQAQMHRLHPPAKSVFEALITDKLREEIFNAAEN